MAELLNLDELVSVPRKVTLNGTDYELAEQSVDQMLQNLRQAKKASEAGEETGAEYVLEKMRDTAIRVLPSCPKDILGALKMRQLIALIEFASKSDEDVNKDVKAAEQGEESAGKQQ